jgi:hypothetical protein
VPWITTRKGPWTCQPINGVALNPNGTLTAAVGNAVAQDVANGCWRNQHAREILTQYDVPLIPVYNVTVPAWEFHRHNLDGQECSHYCHPSLPQLWLWHLLSTFREQQLPVVEEPSGQQQQQQQAGCAVVYDWEERKYGTPRPDAAALAVRDRQRSFWKWLASRSSFLSSDGLLVPPSVQNSASRDNSNNTSSSDSSSSSDGKSEGTAGSVTAWQLLQKLLDLQLLQQPHQQQQTPKQQGQLKGADAAQQPQEAQQQQQSSVTRRQMPHVQQERARSEQLEKGSRTKQTPGSPYQQQLQQRQWSGATQQQLGRLQQQQQQGQEQLLVTRLRRKKQQHQQRRAAASGTKGRGAAAGQNQAQDD